MEQHHRDLIDSYLPDLIIVTVNLEIVVHKLLENEIINEWMKRFILSGEEERPKIIRLYDVIQSRGPLAFSYLCKCLEETSNIRALKILRKSRGEGFEKKEGDMLPNVLNELVNNMNLNEENSSKHDEPYVKIHPELQRMDDYDKNLPTGAYPMLSHPKGHAIILNINKVQFRDERTGSNVDVQNLNKLFKGLGYVVSLYEDLTKTQFEAAILNFIKKCSNEKTNSVVVFIMSHGEAGHDSTRSLDILTSNGIPINTDWIIEQFDPNKIDSNTPKLFFIQACRGNNSDFGWKSVDDENNRLQTDSTGDSTIGNNYQRVVNRRYENIFIAYATVPGYKAKRHPVDGSWFVQKLCEVIRKNAWQLDLDFMMKMVDIEIRKLNSIEHGFQTVEWSYRGFNKKFYFNPGIYENSHHDN